jgi:hypothetical protein
MTRNSGGPFRASDHQSTMGAWIGTTLKASGQTMLLSEQNLRFATRLCDRAYVLEQGTRGRSPSWRRTSAPGKRTSSYERPSGDVSGEVKSMRAERPRDLLILTGGTHVQVRARGARA